jgi:hypothetical protein
MKDSFLDVGSLPPFLWRWLVNISLTAGQNPVQGLFVLPFTQLSFRG